jgi:hypothetical protein
MKVIGWLHAPAAIRWRWLVSYMPQLPLDESDWLVTCPSCLIPGKAPPVAIAVEGWVGSRFGLDISSENDLLPLLGIEPRFLGLPGHSLGTVLWNICTSNMKYSEGYLCESSTAIWLHRYSGIFTQMKGQMPFYTYPHCTYTGLLCSKSCLAGHHVS